MSTYQTDSRIDEYIQTFPGWQQEMCRQVRDLVHAAAGLPDGGVHRG